MFTISEGHGPCLLESIGAIVASAGSATIVREAWKRRGRLAARVPARYGVLAVFVLGVGVGLLLASIFRGWEYWWTVGVALLALVQLLALVLAVR